MPKDKDTHSRSSARRTTGDRDLADLGVDPISADDYFLKSDNFRLWLRKEKGKVRVPISASSAERGREWLTDSNNPTNPTTSRIYLVFRRAFWGESSPLLCKVCKGQRSVPDSTGHGQLGTNMPILWASLMRRLSLHYFSLGMEQGRTIL